MNPINSEDIKVGDYVGKWELNKKIAKSGFNDIYVGSFENVEAVIKIPRNEEFWDKIDNEIQCLKYLENKFSFFPHILDSYNPNDPIPWLAIEIIEGENLKDVVTNKGPLEEIEWFGLAGELMRALSILQSKNITHEDIKPTNIFFNKGEFKLIDFGLARIPNSENSKLYGDSSVIDSWAGTFEYSSPEHFSGEHVSEMDVFSAASTLVFAGTGRSPFNASNSSEWMRAIGRDAPNFHNLSETQIKFINPLFAKNKSERQNSKEATKFLTEFNKSVIIENNPLFLSWPQIKNLTGTNFENEQIYQKLFRNRARIKLARILKEGWKITGNTVLVLLVYFIYFEPLNSLIQDLPPDNISERRQSNKVANTISCLYDSYQADLTKITSSYSQKQNPDIKQKVDDIKLKCAEIAKSGEALGYLGLANLSFDPKTKEYNLIQGAKIDENNGFDELLSFYSETIYLNFDILGKPTLESCTIQKDPFCLRVMGLMYYKVGRSTLINEYLNDYENWEMKMSNEDTVKGLNYLRQASALGDSSSATFLSTVLRSQLKPVEYLSLIEKSANDGNLTAIRWMYGQAIGNGDIASQELWKGKLKKTNDSSLAALEVIIEYSNKNYDKADALVEDCLKELEPHCYSFYGMRLDEKVGVPKSEVEKYRLLGAIMGNINAINAYAEIKMKQGNIDEAEKWYRKGITENDFNSYLGLGNLYLTTNNIDGACRNFRTAAVIANREITLSGKNQYFNANFDRALTGSNELAEDLANVDYQNFRSAKDKIEANCLI